MIISNITIDYDICTNIENEDNKFFKLNTFVNSKPYINLFS